MQSADVYIRTPVAIPIDNLRATLRFDGYIDVATAHPFRLSMCTKGLHRHSLILRLILCGCTSNTYTTPSGGITVLPRAFIVTIVAPSQKEWTEYYKLVKRALERVYGASLNISSRDKYPKRCDVCIE